MQRSFKLYIESNSSCRLITNFNLDSYSDTSNFFSTFDEKISFQEHDQSTLTFSVMKYAHTLEAGEQQIHNELLKLLTIGSQVRLIEDNMREFVFVVQSIEPALNKNNVCYNFTCQDEISYRWSRIKVGYSYSTIERGAPRNIYTIVQEILEDCHLDHWDVVQSTELETVNTLLSTQKVTFEIDNSNPYNAIIEACNTVNAQLSIDYRNKTLTFFNKNNRPFSGYRYRPELNLSKLGASYSGENMATIMHVTGGTNERDINVTLVPYMPSVMQNLLLSSSPSWIGTGVYDGWYSNRIFPIYWQALTQAEFATIDYILNQLNEDFYANPQSFPQEFKDTYVTSEAYIDYVSRAYTNVKDYNMHILNLQTIYAYKYLPYTLTQVDSVPEQYAQLYTLDEYNKHIVEQQEIELQEFKEFVQVANRQVHLGQFLINFDFFKNSKLMPTSIYNEIMHLFNVQMRDNNIFLKIYTQTHYELIWELNQRLTDLRGYLDQASAMYSAIYTKSQEQASTGDTSDLSGMIYEYSEQAQQHLNDAEQILGTNNTKIHALIRSIYGNCQPVDIPELSNLKREYIAYQNVRDEAIVKKAELDRKLLDDTLGEYERIQLESERQYYQSRYNTAISLCGDGNKTNPEGTWVVTTGCVASSVYKILIDNLINSYVPEEYDSGTYNKIQYYEKQNALLWKTLYRQYAQFIYEQTYENSDELDSLNLYNQAISYFEDYNKPSASYTVDTLDLGALEPISLPRVKVGYNIRVYNDYLNLNDEALNNIQFTNNELIITSISYDLRSSQKVSIGVEQITQYQTILQKLIKVVK